MRDMLKPNGALATAWKMAHKPKILCVDDQAVNLRIRTMLLQQFGCETIAVEDHHSALRAIDKTDVDLVLIDYHLAGESTGEDLARDLRVIQPKLPLVMLTGDASLPNSVRECVDAVLIKGASNPRDLLDTIRRLLPEATLKAQPPMLIPAPPAKAS